MNELLEIGLQWGILGVITVILGVVVVYLFKEFKRGADKVEDTNKKGWDKAEQMRVEKCKAEESLNQCRLAHEHLKGKLQALESVVNSTTDTEPKEMLDAMKSILKNI